MIVLNKKKFRSIFTYSKSGFLCSSDFKEQLDGTWMKLNCEILI